MLHAARPTVRRRARLGRASGVRSPRNGRGDRAGSKTGLAAVIPALPADFGLGQILDASDALGGAGTVLSRSWRGVFPGRNLASDTHAITDMFTEPAR
jgi:hypothetical protein